MIITEWVPVEREVMIEHDLENSPLLIKTDTIMNFSPEKLYVEFLGLQEKEIGGLDLYLGPR